MNGDHDLGGVLGFGPVVVERDEPVFHEPWEGLAFALNLASIGGLRAYNADAYRHAVERVPDYLKRSYYERLLTGMSTLLVERGVLGIPELVLPELVLPELGVTKAEVAISNPLASTESLRTEDFSDYERDEPRFRVRQSVRVIASPTDGHTRCPAYLRGATGTVERVYPLAHLPEVRAHSSLRCREHTYAVIFDAHTLWPDDAPSNSDHRVIVEVFESYLAANDPEESSDKTEGQI